jgi:L-ascorbate metabolism protein UlaG (beta-lactamase superfamily)
MTDSIRSGTKGDTVVTSVGNAGFLVRHGRVRLVFDPLVSMFPVDRWIPAREPGSPTLILITHDHWDHFDAADVAGLAERLEAVVVGSAAVSRKLARRLSPDRVIEQEPARPGAQTTARIGDVQITTFRTLHGQRHNSYRVEMPGLRLLHDGDNEHTETLDRRLLQDLDAVMMAPWRGSGWVEFLDEIRARHWFLMHMDEDELNQHERGEFFTDLCDHVPAGLVALRPGHSFAIPGRS